MNFQGTLRMGSEDPSYHIEKARKRPRRQRVVGIMLLLLAGWFVAMAFVATPTQNTTGTVVGTHVLGEEPVSLDVAYVDSDGSQVTATVLLPAGWSTADHPVGSTIGISASKTDVGGPQAVIPTAHPWAMGILAGVAVAGALALWRAARRNDRRFVDGDVNHWKVFAGPGMKGPKAP